MRRVRILPKVGDEQGGEVKFPLDVEGADFVFVPAVSGLLTEAETLMGNAAVFAGAGGSRLSLIRDSGRMRSS